MFEALEISSFSDLVPFALVLARVAGLFAAIPVFGGKVVPQRVKIALTFALSLVLFEFVKPHAIPTEDGVLPLGLLVIREGLVGITLSLLSQFIFAAVEFCGQLVGHQIGLSAASMFDPTTQNQVPTVGVFQTALATLLFLALDVHHFFIRGILDSYQLVPLGAWHVSGDLIRFLIDASTGMFLIAIKLAAPVSVALLATSVALGIVARAFPAMNVFIVSMPLNIGIGLMVMGVSLPSFVRVLSAAFSNLTGQMNTLFKLLG